jgi:hypothetical protein
MSEAGKRLIGAAQEALGIARGWQPLETAPKDDTEIIGHDIKTDPRRVILESPYAGDVSANVQYARQCLRDSVLRGEGPHSLAPAIHSAGRAGRRRSSGSGVGH